MRFLILGPLEVRGEEGVLALGGSKARAVLAMPGERIGDARRTDEMGELIAPYADRAVIAARGAVCLGPVSRFAGIAAATVGRTKEAIAHFEHALTTARRWAAEPLVTAIRLDLAEILERSREESPDHVRRARELRAEGLESARRMELGGLQERWDHAGQDTMTAPPPPAFGSIPHTGTEIA